VRVQRTIEVLEALVGFDTTSRNSNLPLVEWVEAYLDRFGVAHDRVPDKTGSKAQCVGDDRTARRARNHPLGAHNHRHNYG
jgi:acetylornithine deacetylase/succinyl-diaminopimelate desuccinylase-like protein